MTRNSQPLLGRTVLVGVCGSVAAYKAVYLVRRLTEAGARVQVVMTASAGRFITPLTFESVSGNPVISDLYDLPANRHIELGENTDLAVIAPATANLLARHAHGLADDALTTLLLALRGPLLLAPAMDGGMWEHPATQSNVDTLKSRGVHFVGPEHGALASGLVATGRMAEPDDILEHIVGLLRDGKADAPGKDGDLTGHHLLVTAGPTREHLDPVRYISNPSTGRMGFAVAEQAARRGARVTLIAGPTHLPTPDGVARIDVVTAGEMQQAVYTHVTGATALVMAAAVSDFRPQTAHAHKVKKGDSDETLTLTRTGDILKGLDPHAPAGLIRVGFAAETRDLAGNAKAKLKAKNLDLIVANDVTEPGAGFASETNRVLLIDAQGEEILSTRPKGEVADAILDRIARLRPPHLKTA